MKKIWKNTWAVLDEREKRKFGFLIVADIVVNILDILSLAGLLWIVQFYIQPRQNGILSGWLNSKNSFVFITVFFLLFALKNGAAFLIARRQYTFISTIAIRLSRQNLVHYQQSGYEEFVNIDSSAHIRKICLQPFDFCQYLLSGIQQIITQLSLIGLTIIAIILFNAKLFLLLLVILLPPVIIVFYFIKRRLTRAKKHIQTSNEKSYQYLLDALKGWVESNVYDRNEFFLQRFVQSRKKFSTHLFDSLALQSLPSRIIEIFAILGLFILIAIARWTGTNDSATLITIGAFMAAAYKIIPGIVKVINISGQIRAYEFSLDNPAIIQPQKSFAQNKQAPVSFQSLQFMNIGFRYGSQQVLSNLSFSIDAGDFLGISGKSGKGKTTIFNLMLGFLEPHNGEINFNGHSYKHDPLKQYWPLIAYVRQQPFFIHDTLLKNITLEENGFDKERLASATRIAGLDDFIVQFPEGLDKIITENGKNISGGQQQRVAIARALYKNADLILLDEPFNELDEMSETTLLSYFHELSVKGKTVIMITHDKQSLTYCNKIISLDEPQ